MNNFCRWQGSWAIFDDLLFNCWTIGGNESLLMICIAKSAKMTRIISYHLFWFHQTIYVFSLFYKKKNMKNWSDWWEYNHNNIFPYSEHLIPSQRVGSIIKSVIFKNVLRSAFFTEQCIMTMGRRESSAPQSGVVLLFSAFHKRSLTIENHNSREMRFISCSKMPEN